MPQRVVNNEGETLLSITGDELLLKPKEEPAVRKVKAHGATKGYAMLYQATHVEQIHERKQKKVRNWLIVSLLLFIAAGLTSWLGSHYWSAGVLCVALLPLWRVARIQHEYDLRHVK